MFSIALINSGMLIGFATNGCPWITSPLFASLCVTSAVRKIIGVSCNSRSASICVANSPPSIFGITMSSKITSGLKLWAVWSALAASFSSSTRYGPDLSRRIFTRCVLFASSSTIRIRRLTVSAEPETGFGRGESVPATRGKRSASSNFFTMFQSVWSHAEPGNKPCSLQAQKRTQQRAGHGKPERNHFS
jgi:hypothetical protein